MIPKYLYVDDEDNDSIQPIADALNDTRLVNVVLFRICDMKDEDRNFDGLIRALIADSYDGLILDLRLDEAAGSGFFFRAPAVAQELRSRAAEGELVATPIILCSTDAKMRATYNSDKTSHNLFDYKFEKGADSGWPKIANKLSALAAGYKVLNEAKSNVSAILAREDYSGVDERIIQTIGDTDKLPNTHDRAAFMVKSLFHHPGSLIKERLLAARLGVDVGAAPDSWKQLKEKFLASFSYSGVFSTGWQRWWAEGLINWFEGKSEQSLESMPAEERVSILNELEGIDGLVAAKPIKNCNSTKFWSVCEGHKAPLDPLEGFWVYEKSDLRPWQEHRYVSLDAVLERIDVDKGLRAHPSELENINLQKELLEDE